MAKLQRFTPLYQQAYQLLRQQILQGEYAPGEALQESRIAEVLSVSRTPVREALRQLEREGLVVTDGYERMVANPTEEEFVDLYTCRAALEDVVAERAAQVATQKDLDLMTAALEEARAASAAEDHAGVVAANTRFHDQMVESVRMPRLRQLMESIRGPILIARCYVISNSTTTEAAIWEEHYALLHDIRQRDAQGARERMKAHMDNDIERGLARFTAS